MLENLSFLAKAGNIVPARSSWSTISRFYDGLTNLHSMISNCGRLSSVDPFIPFTRTIVICFDIIENSSLIICLQTVVVSNTTPVKKYSFNSRKFRKKFEYLFSIYSTIGAGLFCEIKKTKALKAKFSSSLFVFCDLKKSS